MKTAPVKRLAPFYGDILFRVYLKTVNMPEQRVFSGFQIDPNSAFLPKFSRSFS